MNDLKALWIEVGYELFAMGGPKNLKVEPLAKRVGISKSSFYHHFADTEVFTAHLLRHHLVQCRIIADKERRCQTIDPELVDVIIEHKTDLLFNRQLRVLRGQAPFNETLQASDQIVGDSFVEVWAKDLRLDLSPSQLGGLFELALENFYLQLTPENIHYQWLSGYFSNLKRIASAFGRPGLDAAV